MRIMIVIAYDGRPHSGWQSQPGGNTIQDHLETAATAVAKQPIRIHGSGRTDAGVHATAQVAHFDAPDQLTMNPFNWVPALNTKLPPSIRVIEATEVDDQFHARFSASGKTYRYEISTEPVLSPFRAGFAWHLPRQFDPYLLEDALQLTLGRHDFQAFSAKRGNETEASDFHRTLSQARCQALDYGWRLTWSGNGFLYKMVRLLTGTVLEVAQGRMRLDDFQLLLDQPRDLPHGRAPLCAPGDGLFLDRVEFHKPTKSPAS
ncbi:MAG: tRNA pseudouridine(38-40) synthase TruA [Verrucomicrobiales bacterium]